MTGIKILNGSAVSFISQPNHSIRISVNVYEKEKEQKQHTKRRNKIENANHNDKQNKCEIIDDQIETSEWKHASNRMSGCHKATA